MLCRRDLETGKVGATEVSDQGLTVRGRSPLPVACSSMANARVLVLAVGDRGQLADWLPAGCPHWSDRFAHIPSFSPYNDPHSQTPCAPTSFSRGGPWHPGKCRVPGVTQRVSREAHLQPGLGCSGRPGAQPPGNGSRRRSSQESQETLVLFSLTAAFWKTGCCWLRVVKSKLLGALTLVSCAHLTSLTTEFLSPTHT